MGVGVGKVPRMYTGVFSLVDHCYTLKKYVLQNRVQNKRCRHHSWHHWYPTPTSPGKLAQKSCVALIIISSSSALDKSKESMLKFSSASSGGISFEAPQAKDPFEGVLLLYSLGDGFAPGCAMKLWLWRGMFTGFALSTLEDA
jgi:hypothetical protein